MKKTTKTNGETKVTLPRNDPLVKRLLAVATASGRSPQDIVNSTLKEEIPKMENAVTITLTPAVAALLYKLAKRLGKTPRQTLHDAILYGVDSPIRAIPARAK